MMAKKNKSSQTGDVVKINLGTDMFCFGRVLNKPLMAFYDMQVSTVPEIEEIVRSQILFRVWVMNSAVSSGRWPVIGNLPLESELKHDPAFFKQDPITKEFLIYHKNREFSATRDECEKLERAAVWSPEHIEDRLRDYYSGVANQWEESLKPQ